MKPFRTIPWRWLLVSLATFVGGAVAAFLTAKRFQHDCEDSWLVWSEHAATVSVPLPHAAHLGVALWYVTKGESRCVATSELGRPSSAAYLPSSAGGLPTQTGVTVTFDLITENFRDGKRFTLQATGLLPRHTPGRSSQEPPRGIYPFYCVSWHFASGDESHPFRIDAGKRYLVFAEGDAGLAATANTSVEDVALRTRDTTATYVLLTAEIH